MPARTIALPNIRSQYGPDPGYTIVDCDLAGADAQVVAWEADDEDMKAAFRAGLKLHVKNAREVFPEITKDMTDEEIKRQKQPGGIYYDCKRAVHATNYGASPHGLAPTLKWPVARCQEFQSRWFFLHPGIQEWHKRTMRHLTGEECWWCHTRTERPFGRCKVCDNVVGRTVGNRFGFRRIYFDRIEGLLPEALAWVPQSTVVIVCDRGAIQLAKNHRETQLLLQNHDSIVFQTPHHFIGRKKQYLESLRVPVPYKDPLNIQWGWSDSRLSWGDCG